ncbi:MAG TPA: prolyl oligopeptidase family serine peptidase [Gemmatimonadaceae bacterium]|nr:prolyl oligopeptidase family serine peptidase [Gemmatimonadaceae bacterium]
MTRRVLLLAAIAAPLAAGAQSQRPMTFLDVQNMRQANGQDLSPDGRQMVYVLSTPDWATVRRQSDLYLVSTDRGLPSTRQLTFTKDKNETSPKWSRDGSFIAFLSDRDATTAAGGGGGRGAAAAGGARNQIYVLRLDGGEAKRVSDAREGVSNFSFAKDGRTIVYTSGRAGDDQLYTINVSDLFTSDAPHATQLTRHATGVGAWQFSPDGKRIYFVSADSIDRDDRTRTEKQFTVKPRNPAASVASLWSFDIAARQEHRLTSDSSYSVSDFSVSPDGKWIGFHGQSPSRYERGILEQNDYADLYLLNTGSGNIERLTKNDIIGESALSFSPDSKMIAFAAPDDFKFMHDEKIYVRPVDQPNAPLKKLGENIDVDVRVGGRGGAAADGAETAFWSEKGDTIYFGTGIHATTQFFAVSTTSGVAKQITDVKGTISVARDDEAHRYLITFADPKNPPATYTVASMRDVNDRAKWVQLTDPNAWVKQQVALGDEEEISWKSKDGTTVSGVLLKPVGYQPGKKYPLIVAIHGGPAAADMLSFNGGYGSQVYAGAGYVVLMPNYRASTQYGDKFKTETFGDYFTKGYQDIMTGVDLLISQGLVDSTQMGVLGWSAGGHYSNWIETHTNRFKAISSGAGVANWISMWSQSDTQRLRQWYLGDKMYWEPGQLENWWKQSPIATVKNAKTPIFIHVVEGDPRVPRPQSEEMHMALSKLGVPNEFWVYPGNTHGIPDPRNQYLKAVAEMSWMDYYVRGSGKKFAWRDVLKSVETGTGPQLAGEAMPQP